MKKVILRIVASLQSYDIQSIRKDAESGEWEIVILAEVENWETSFDICRKLTGTDNADFFSIRGIEKIGAMTYKARVIRVVSDAKENQT